MKPNLLHSLKLVKSYVSSENVLDYHKLGHEVDLNRAILAGMEKLWQKVWAALEGGQIEALWVTTPENVRYLSKFTSPEDARVLLYKGEATLFTDSRYTVQAEQESTLPSFIWRQGDEWKTELKKRLEGVRVGFEASNLTVEKLEELRSLEGTMWTSSLGLLEGLRAVKTLEEVAQIRAACALTDKVLAEVVPMLVPGVREVDIALELEFRMRRAGAEGAAFNTIVASGLRSSMPHGRASAKVLEVGDLVTIDLGAKLGGYHSDMTRAYPVGEVSAELKKLYRAVKQAKKLALEAASPGMGCRALDAVTRDYLKSEGFETEFAHSLGHGVGLAVHETPRLSFRSEESEILEVGNVVTLEPGLYVPGLGGVRLEDLVVITETGCEVLTKSAEVDL